MTNKTLMNTYIDNIIKFFLLLIIGTVPSILRIRKLEYIAPKLEPELLATGVYVRPYDKVVLELFYFLLAIIILLFFIKLFFEQIIIEKIDYLIFSIIVIFLLSTFFSEYLPVAYKGTYNRMDGAQFLVFSFLFLFILSKLTYDDREIRILFFASVIFVIVNLAITFANYKGINLVTNPFFLKLISGSSGIETKASGYIVSTLDNPNYLSAFSGFLASLFFGRLISGKDTFLKKLPYMVFFFFSSFLLFNSFSSSGFVALYFVFAFSIPFLLKYADLSKGLVAYLIAIVLFFLAFKLSTSWNSRALHEVNTIKAYVLNHLTFFVILTLGIILCAFILVTFQDFILAKGKGINIFIALLIIAFFLLIPHSAGYEKEYPYKTYTDEEIISIIKSKEGKSDITSGRLIAWQQTIDLIKDKPLFGYGLATFPYEIRQETLFDTSKGWPTGSIFDKPHNTYLGLAYGSGIFALIVFAILYYNIIIITIANFKINFSSFDFSLLMGILAYLVQAMINDINLASFIVFIAFTAILISRNRKLEE